MEKRQVGIRIREDLYEKIVEIAEREHRSVSAQITHMLDRHVGERDLVAEGGTQIDVAEIRRRAEA